MTEPKKSDAVFQKAWNAWLDSLEPPVRSALFADGYGAGNCQTSMRWAIEWAMGRLQGYCKECGCLSCFGKSQLYKKQGILKDPDEGKPYNKSECDPYS